MSGVVDARLDARDTELLGQIHAANSLSAPEARRLIARLLAPYEAMIDGIVAARLWRLDEDGVEEGVQRVYEDMLGELEGGKTWNVPFRAVVAARIEFTCRDVWRDRLRAKAREMPTDEGFVSTATPADPAEVAAAAVTLEQLRAALTDDEWAVIQATWVEGRRSIEAAAQLGISEGALNTRKTRIKAKVAGLISDE